MTVLCLYFVVGRQIMLFVWCIFFSFFHLRNMKNEKGLWWMNTCFSYRKRLRGREKWKIMPIELDAMICNGCTMWIWFLRMNTWFGSKQYPASLKRTVKYIFRARNWEHWAENYTLTQTGAIMQFKPKQKFLNQRR